MASKKPSGPTGPDLIDQMAAEPSLDRFFINKPSFTDAELLELIDGLRKERVMWETKK
jgi:hypothetical protein